MKLLHLKISGYRLLRAPVSLFTGGHYTNLDMRQEACWLPQPVLFYCGELSVHRVSEGCAKVAERLVYAPEWLSLQNVPRSEIDALVVWEQASERARMRDILADIEFEKLFYEQSEIDVDFEFRRIEREIAGVEQPDNAPFWALQRQLAFRPRERIHYLLARCAQAAIYRRLRKLEGGLLGTEAKQVLRKDVFEYAAGRRFEEWFVKAAGVEPGCDAWLQDVARIKN